jgi:hypothetical protein
MVERVSNMVLAMTLATGNGWRCLAWLTYVELAVRTGGGPESLPVSSHPPLSVPSSPVPHLFYRRG